MKTCLSTLLLLLVPCFAFSQHNFFVSSTGNDANTGTSSAPFSTLQKALEAVAKVDKSKPGSTVVTINGGTYQLTSPLAIDEFVGGIPTHPVTIKATAGANVKIGGGISIKDWTPTNGKPYFQKTLTINEVRDLYVEGERRTRARTNERITGINFPGTVSCRYIRLSHSRAGDHTIAEFRAFADPTLILGTDDDKKEGAFNFTIYPNPVHGNTVMVDMPDNNTTQGARLELFSLDGKRLNDIRVEKSGKRQTVEVDVSHISTGTYLLCLIADQSRITKN